MNEEASFTSTAAASRRCTDAMRSKPAKWHSSATAASDGRQDNARGVVTATKVDLLKPGRTGNPKTHAKRQKIEEYELGVLLGSLNLKNIFLTFSHLSVLRKGVRAEKWRVLWMERYFFYCPQEVEVLLSTHQLGREVVQIVQ